jgi:hypothetical protein
MDGAWETDDPDVDIDDIEGPLSTFDGLVEGFLLAKPSDRNSCEALQQQSKQPPKTHAKRAR